MNEVYLTKSAKTLIFNEISIQFFRLMPTPKSQTHPICQFADLHCHTSILPFSYSFAPKQPHPRGNIWHSHQVNFLRKCVKWSTGIPWFTQADLSAMAKGNMRLAIVALCPPEKQFLFDTFGRGRLSAAMCNFVMGIGYHRVRQVQREMDYFRELCGEYEFFIRSQRERPIGEKVYRWRPARNGKEVSEILSADGEIAVLFSIEGGHVFNSGLGHLGKASEEEEILGNIQRLKSWEYPPVYITLNHFYNNDLCGHARSLDHLPRFVDQRENMGNGISALGEKVIHALLADKPVYIDLKHMSLAGRRQYSDLLQAHYDRPVPLIASHGAVTGVKTDGSSTLGNGGGLFNLTDINFFDDEIVQIARSGGLFGVQFDTRRITSNHLLKQAKRVKNSQKALALSAQLIWNQIRHVAELLDHHGLFAWGTASIGSDFDGFVDPLEGIFTVEDFPKVREPLLQLANAYLQSPNRLTVPENKAISPEEVVSRFCFDNVLTFITNHF
jgi:microsomal dipeptidase-like Zn-dependent dipeptidase